MTTVDEVEQGLRNTQSKAGAHAATTVDVAVDSAINALARPSPGRAILVRRVWEGTQTATVKVSGATPREVARAKEAGRKAGMMEARREPR